MNASTDNLTPGAIAKKTFGSRLRGVDPTEVSTYLERVAAQLETAETDRDAWRAEVDRLRDEITSLQESLRETQAEPDEAALTEQLGQEAGRVLTEARAAAADRLAEAEAEAADIIAAAEELHAERSRSADAEAERIRSEAIDEERRLLEAADDEAGTIRDKARQDAEEIRAGAGVDQQAADAEAARIIREAELTRRRILEDLARRRSAARRQIEQLRAGRERLLASHEVVRRALEEISEELNISMSEARAAAETAGHSVSDSTLEEIEAEIETAKLAGLLDTGPVPVVSSSRSSSDGEATVELAPVDTPIPEASVPEAAAPDTAPSVDASVDGEGNDTEVETEVDVAEDHAERAEAAPVADDGAADEPAELSDGGPEPDITASADAAAGDEGDGPLAEVVSLTAARQDVDTDRHPANRRSPSTPESADVPIVEVEPEPVVEAEPEPAVEPEPVAAAGAEAEPEPEPADEPTRVDSLFARMRQTQDAAVIAGTVEAEPTAGEPEDPSDPQRLADEVGRKMKRVLADEQSEVLSTLRAGADDATLTTLLGSQEEHRLRYWAVTESVLIEHHLGSPDAETEVGRLVDAIRRRVEGCLGDLAEDPDAVVDRLRSVYREVKTQRIAEHAQLICGALEDLTAS